MDPKQNMPFCLIVWVGLEPAVKTSYRNDLKFSDRQAWANSGKVTLFIILDNYSKFSGVRFFRIFTVITSRGH